MNETERLIEFYNQLEDAGLMVIAGKKDSAELMVSRDVVPVVRCKNCKDHDRCEVEDLLVKFLCIENAYCAAGERKDNETD